MQIYDYERQHKKPMDCDEIYGLLLEVLDGKRIYLHQFTVLGGFDSEGAQLLAFSSYSYPIKYFADCYFNMK